MSTNLFKSYFHCALSPWDFQKRLRQENIKDQDNETDNDISTPSLLEFIIIAWFFLLIYEIVDLFLLSQGHATLEEKSILILGKILFVIFFPIYALALSYFLSKFIFFIGSYSEHYQLEKQSEEFLQYEDTRLKKGLEQVVASLFCSYLFLPIPVIGILLHELALLFYLIIGLKKNLQFTKLEIASVFLIPIFIFLTFIVVLSSILIFAFFKL